MVNLFILLSLFQITIPNSFVSLSAGQQPLSCIWQSFFLHCQLPILFSILCFQILWVTSYPGRYAFLWDLINPAELSQSDPIICLQISHITARLISEKFLKTRKRQAISIRNTETLSLSLCQCEEVAANFLHNL